MYLFPRCARLPFLAAVCLFLPTISGLSQTRRAKTPGDVAISPDGSSLAWTLRDDEDSAIHLTEREHPGKTRLIAPHGTSDCSSESPVWSPDGQTLAFTSDCNSKDTKSGQEQIFLWTKATGEIRQLTHVTGNIEHAAWSPDGRQIGFLFVKNATRSAGALDAMKPWSGVIGEDGVEVQQVYVVSASDGQENWETLTEQHVYEFAWSPDSMQIAYIAANPPGENNWWVAKLYAQHVLPRGEKTQKDWTVVLDPNTVSGSLHGLQIAVPRWSPDGQRIALIGGLMSDQGSTGGDVWVIDAKGGDPIDITPGIDGTPCYEDWISDHTVSFVEDRRGHTLLNAVNINTKAIVPGAPIDLGEVTVSGGPIKDAISISGRINDEKERVTAFVRSGHNTSPELWAGVATDLKQITHLNDGVKPSVRMESIEWENEGFHVQGWLTYPKDYDPAKKYPLIVEVHGGPSASAAGRGGSMWAEHGYFDFQPNPRGSFGQGEAFVQANRKDFGYGDLSDILKGMDTIEAKVPIDKDREGLTGWSYGGFMTMFAVTQTHRFHAAIAGAGISNWLSYYGENSIDQWMIPFFGASVYDDPAVYAKSSAITFIKNVKTPTLVIVGDRDGECPAPQSFEFWHALRDLGVKTQLVIYPNEGHGFRNPEHIRDRIEREVKWFAENMPEKQ
jgi:dipeptidyl aminopeptidase/acylaminoacyl peptidase